MNAEQKKILAQKVEFKAAQLMSTAGVVARRAAVVQNTLKAKEYGRINGLGELQGLAMEFDRLCGELSTVLGLADELEKE